MIKNQSAELMEGFAFQVKVVRTDRKKSVSIQIEGDSVKVRVPRLLSNARIRDLLVRRTAWINNKLKEQSKRPVPRSMEYASGENIPYLGRNYRLKIVQDSEASVQLNAGCLVVTVSKSDPAPQATIRLQVILWYRRKAEEYLAEKTAHWAKKMSVQPRSVSVKDYKTRWGSCSIRGDISYNWRVILTPSSVVDYLVVHELCHLLEHNHSPAYWRHVGRFIPDHKKRRAWLKQRGNLVVP